MKPSIRNRHDRGVALLFAFAVLFVAQGTAQAPNKTTAPDYSAIRSDFRASIPKLMSQDKVPGLAIAVVDGQQILCIECLEARIGRPLVAYDFTDAPINDLNDVDGTIVCSIACADTRNWSAPGSPRVPSRPPPNG